jgi:hypothetical protein
MKNARADARVSAIVLLLNQWGPSNSNARRGSAWSSIVKLDRAGCHEWILAPPREKGYRVRRQKRFTTHAT